MFCSILLNEERSSLKLKTWVGGWVTGLSCAGHVTVSSLFPTCPMSCYWLCDRILVCGEEEEEYKKRRIAGGEVGGRRRRTWR